MLNATPRPLYPQERPGNHCTGGWVGPRTGLEGSGKSRPAPAFDPRTVQSVASRCYPGPLHICIYMCTCVHVCVCVCACVCMKHTKQVTSDVQPFPSIDHTETWTVQNCGEIYCKNMRTVHVSSVCGHIIQRNYTNLSALRHEIHQQAVPTLHSIYSFHIIHLG